jgi:hypothetical protein
MEATESAERLPSTDPASVEARMKATEVRKGGLHRPCVGGGTNESYRDAQRLPSTDPVSVEA